MQNYYLAVDIGASSGRHMLGHLEDGKMIFEEVYRFENGMTKQVSRLLPLPADIFLPLQMPGTEVGELKKEIQECVGFNCKVALCAPVESYRCCPADLK